MAGWHVTVAYSTAELEAPIRIGIDAHMIGSRETGNETYVLGIIDGLASLEEDSELYVYHARERIERGAPRVHPRQFGAHRA